MSVQIFIRLLFGMSVFTSLITEACKKFLNEFGIKYYSNAIAGLIAIVAGAFLCVGYTVYTGVNLNASMIYNYILLTVLSWVSAMVGYDKVMQTLKQLGGM